MARKRPSSKPSRSEGNWLSAAVVVEEEEDDAEDEGLPVVDRALDISVLGFFESEALCFL
jgi:hypothetical protein